VSRLCRTYGAFLIVDEIQTGLGRLGAWWGMDADAASGLPPQPDVLLVGKGLSGGVVPVAAMVATAAAYGPFSRDPYLHTSTFAASPIACAAALAAVEALDREGVVPRAKALGERLLAGVRAACAPYTGGLVREVRGRGLLIGLEFTEEQAVGELILELVGRGVLVNHSLNATRVLRLTPPAIVGEEEVRLFLTALTEALRVVATHIG
jgi:putrescine aminotransferase